MNESVNVYEVSNLSRDLVTGTKSIMCSRVAVIIAQDRFTTFCGHVLVRLLHCSPLVKCSAPNDACNDTSYHIFMNEIQTRINC